MRNVFSLSSLLLLCPLLVACSDDTTKAKPDLARVADRGAADRSTAERGAAVDKSATGADKRGGAPDTTPTGCPTSYAGCSTYQDATGGTATITFGVGGNVYSPNCLKVKVGQSVTFSGSFSVHPLGQAPCAPAQVLTGASGTSATFTFTLPGIYGFYCMVHGTPQGTGMAGALMVVP